MYIFIYEKRTQIVKKKKKIIYVFIIFMLKF